MKPNVFCGARAVISYFGSEKKLHLFYHTTVSVEDARRDKKFNNKFKFLNADTRKKLRHFLFSVKIMRIRNTNNKLYIHKLKLEGFREHFPPERL